MNETKKLPLVFIEKPLFLMQIGEVGYISADSVRIIYEKSEGDLNDLKYFYVVDLYTSYVTKPYASGEMKIVKVGENDYDVDLNNPHYAFYPEEKIPKEWEKTTEKKSVDIVYVNTKEHYSHFTFYELLEVYNRFLAAQEFKKLEFIWASELLLSYEKACASMKDTSILELWGEYKRARDSDEQIRSTSSEKRYENSVKISKNHLKAAFNSLIEKLKAGEEIEPALLNTFRDDAEEDQEYEILALLEKNYFKEAQ